MALRTAGLLTLIAAVAASVPAAAQTAGDSRPSATEAATRTVVLRGIAFHPSRVTIARGDRVVWRWRDGGIPHNVTSRRFRSSATRSSGSYAVRFRSAGTYRYRCTIHPGMRGAVVVRR